MAIIGGSLLSISSSINLLLKGRITGISGITYGILSLTDYFWKFYFILGLFCSASLTFAFWDQNLFDNSYNFTQDLTIIGFILSGLFVGFGTKLSNGCTSGHGVCGLPRFSKRSFVACCTFFAVGVAIAIFRNYFPFLYGMELADLTKYFLSVNFHIALTFGYFTIVGFLIIKFSLQKYFLELIDLIISFTTGVIFGFGLIISGMVKKTKVINFLNFASNEWDPSLLFVLLSAVSFNLVFFYLILKYRKTPVLADKMSFSTRSDLDFPLIIGAGIFGLGWGISGMCPGPSLLNTFVFFPHTIVFLIAMLLGQFAAGKTLSLIEEREKKKTLLNNKN